MRKLLVLALSLVLVLSVSGVIMAVDATQTFNLKVSPYMTVAFNTPTEWAGLFGDGQDINLGAPGIYISNGLEATAGEVESIWGPTLAVSPSDYVYAPTEISFPVGDEGSELFSVDANTIVDVELSADWDDANNNWVNAPSLLLVHSDSSWSGGDHYPLWNGISEWADFKAYIGNQVTDPENENYQDMVDVHNEIGTENNTFTLDFINEYECKGPIDFTIDGGLLILKASQTPAGNYSANVTITVGATAATVD